MTRTPGLQRRVARSLAIGNACNDEAQPAFDGESDIRKIGREIGRDAAEVLECGVGKDDLHARRNVPNAAPHPSSVAIHPCRAARLRPGLCLLQDFLQFLVSLRRA